MTQDSNSDTIDSTKIRFRYFRIFENVLDATRHANHTTKQEHVLTLATVLEQDKMLVGFSLNRVDKTIYGDTAIDRFDPNYGRRRALGRLNSNHPISISIDRSQPVIDSIIKGLLALPTTGSNRHVLEAGLLGVSLDSVPSVPSALKNVIRKNVKEFQSKPHFEG